MPFLIDTDIIIYSLKQLPVVKENFRMYADDPKAISVITYGELFHGAAKSRDYRKNTATVRRLSELFPITEVTKSVMETFADIKAELQRRGNIIDDMDLIIAATALTMNYTLVTNNEKHFARIPNLRIENWARDRD